MFEDGQYTRVDDAPCVVFIKQPLESRSLSNCTASSTASESAISSFFHVPLRVSDVQDTQTHQEAYGKFGSYVHMQSVNDEYGDPSTDKIGHRVHAVVCVACSISDASREARAFDGGIPHGLYRSALKEKDEHLGRMASGDDSD